MVEEGPIFQMGRYDGKIIELMEDPDFGRLELKKGDIVVVFHAKEFKKMAR